MNPNWAENIHPESHDCRVFRQDAETRMALSSSEIDYLSEVLDKCDAALADKPTLSEIYNPSWRASFRSQTLSADCMADVSYPSAYATHLLELFHPPDYQKRIEEGAAVLLGKLGSADRNHLVSRMRGNGCLSAEEEVLLARGFALEFGATAFLAPPGDNSHPRPEFIVRVQAHEVDVEAKGLLVSQEVQSLNDYARRFGTGGWFTFGEVDSPDRLRAGLARKLLRTRDGFPRIVVLTQYTPWLKPDVSIRLVRQLALSPGNFNIPDSKHPLAIGYVWDRGIQGVWFNRDVQERNSIADDVRERVRTAICSSFYPRHDGLFFDETLDSHQTADLIGRIGASS